LIDKSYELFNFIKDYYPKDIITYSTQLKGLLHLKDH